MNIYFFYITAAAYVVGTVIFTAYLFKHAPRLVTTGKYVLCAGFVAHSATILARWIEAGRTPATNFHESLTFFAWVTVGVYLLFFRKYKLSVLGAFVTPFALLLLITAAFMSRDITPLHPMLESNWLPVHIVIAFLGNAFFALSFFIGLMYIIQDGYLKRRKLEGIYYVLPSLNVLDDLGYKCISIGFSLLTLTIITGAIWSQYTIGSYFELKHRQIFSLIAWILYAALLHGRMTSGWRGRKASIISCIAFGVLIASYLIINILAGGAHGYLQ